MNWIDRHKSSHKKTIDIVLDVDRRKHKYYVSASSPKLDEIEISGVINNELLEKLFVDLVDTIGLKRSKELLQHFDKF